MHETKKDGVPTATEPALVDSFARSINYLRLSLTDQCNLRCRYCSPGEGQKLRRVELLRYEELLRFIRIAVALGVRKVRLTGGEPLVRRDVLSFIRDLAAVPGLADIRITTNGVLLEQHAAGLYASGIRKLNISLDTLRPERYCEITGADLFSQVWRGIERAQELGFEKIKLNVVALRGVNDDEFVELARLTLSRPWQVRFIEFMPVGGAAVWDRGRYIPSAGIMERIGSALGELAPAADSGISGPARLYRLPGGLGTLGFISPISNHFCDRCNRLRLTAEGMLRSCLLSDRQTDLKKILRGGGDDEAVRRAIIEAIRHKPRGHGLKPGETGDCHGRMSRIGG
ncbi:MAG: GTP 3',8-cyclase MoaA [Thermodesulfobacteriota bacterium]